MGVSERFLLTGVGFLFLIIFMVGLGHHGVVCYRLVSSLLHKDLERVFVVPPLLDSYVPVVDLSLLRSIWIWASVRVGWRTMSLLCCPYSAGR